MKQVVSSESNECPWLATYASAGIVADHPEPDHASLAELVHERCSHYATAGVKHPAYTCVMPNGMNGRLSFNAVDELSDAFAGYLRQSLGLNPGDRVAVQLPNCLAYPVVAFGVLKAGCVLVNTNPVYTPDEMLHQFCDSGVRVLVIIDLFADKLSEVLQPSGIEYVVLARVDEWFPTVPRWVIRGVQKWWTRSLPTVTVQHTRLPEALSMGRGTLAEHPAKSYWQDLHHNDLALLQYTGGTTGVSKGAMLSHGNLLNNVIQIQAMGASHLEDATECVLSALPMYHIFAFTANLMSFLAVGAHNVLVPNPRPVQNLQRAVENYPITWMTGVNTLFNGLLNEEWFQAYPPRYLKASIAGGTALHRAVAERWVAVTNTPIGEGYGLTEASPMISFHPLLATQRAGSIGVPSPGTYLRLIGEDGQAVPIGQVGEICVRGPQVMQGYWKNEQETAAVLQAGWLATGDVAVMDPDGFLRIVDRKKDLVLVSGFNVYPNEIEDVIAQMESVLEVAVIGVEDVHTGEALWAYVVANPTASRQTLRSEDVIAHCRVHLSAYKIPQKVHLRKELPKSPIGKVLRKVLRVESMRAPNNLSSQSDKPKNTGTGASL